jgi:3',5'-cyclic AMP phosphodiesterase CpdA
MRILHISDVHFGGEDGGAVAAVSHFVMTERPDLIVASGDLSAQGLQSELDTAGAWLAGLGPPVIATPGNHDVPYFEVLPRFYRPFRRYERAMRANAVRDGWSDGRVRIVTINTARGWQIRPNWALGAISRRQIEAAARALRETPRDVLKIIVTHHPLMFPEDSPVRGQTHGGARAARALIDAGAQLFLAGHLHVTQETRVRGPHGAALALTAGTLSLRLRGEPNGFLMIERPGAQTIRLTRFAIADGAVTACGEDTMALT